MSVDDDFLKSRLPVRPICPDCKLESLTGNVHEEDCVQMKPTMTDLQKKLREKVAYVEPFSETELGLAGVWGAKRENYRLQPILAALEGCVEALEEVNDKSKASANFARSAFIAMTDTALETLRKSLDAR